jgi:hypothetical protein
MPSTYSTSLKLQLIGTGEQAGVWGTTTNTNLGTLLEQAITGVITIPMGDATYTLTNFNGLSDEARNAVLILQGPITSPQFLVAPPGQEKTYIVRNRTGNTVTLTTGTGANVNIANAASEVVFTDGANFFSATQFNYINGDLTVTGNLDIGGTTTLRGNVFGNVNTGQWYIPTGNTASRAANGTSGLFRYNSEAQIYEGYANGVWIRFVTAPQGQYTIEYLVVGGGGGGGNCSNPQAGGGGGAGLTAGSFTASPGGVYTATVAGGGVSNGQGSSSALVGQGTALGGGAGGNNEQNGGTGASGGGGGARANGGSGTAGQGFAGGNGDFDSGGGGGGNSALGGSATDGGGSPNRRGGNGGAGTFNSTSGTSTAYGGGGGGGGVDIAGTGGTGGGGAGGQNIFSGQGSGFPPTAGGTNLGGGGGGGVLGYTAGANGGSGVVVLKVPSVNYSGTVTGSPTVTSGGAYTYVKFTGSGTYTA